MNNTITLNTLHKGHLTFLCLILTSTFYKVSNKTIDNYK